MAEEGVQLRHPEITVVFDMDHAAAAATRNKLFPTLAHEGVMIAGPHMPFPGMGRLRKEANGYVWAPVIFTDQWAARYGHPEFAAATGTVFHRSGRPNHPYASHHRRRFRTRSHRMYR